MIVIPCKSGKCQSYVFVRPVYKVAIGSLVGEGRGGPMRGGAGQARVGGRGGAGEGKGSMGDDLCPLLRGLIH